MFLGLGETDEWGHEDQYDEYLTAAQRFDAYLRELWMTVESHPAYQGRTAIVVTCDHGRGGDDVPGLQGGDLNQWRDHNAKVVGAEHIWVMAWGAGVSAGGEARDLPAPVTQSQIAATVAAILGEDYAAAEPRAARAIEGVMAKPAGR
jgi:phosphopentomutase